MKSRTSNPNNTAWRWYGGKGIAVADEWLTFDGFREWANRAGYANDLTIDRIDSDGTTNRRIADGFLPPRISLGRGVTRQSTIQPPGENVPPG